MHKPTIFLLLMALAAAGCATAPLYDGARRAAGEVVVIEGVSNLDLTAGGHAAKICVFDGQPLSPCAARIEFLPGTHTLKLEATFLGLADPPETITLDFKPGDRYRLTVKPVAEGIYRPSLAYVGNVNDGSVGESK
jgi:hypothetical protein